MEGPGSTRSGFRRSHGPDKEGTLDTGRSRVTDLRTEVEGYGQGLVRSEGISPEGSGGVDLLRGTGTV